ncbi:MFS general substrate transporter [Pseudovirgaria hyperparasitica]|uniref:MFS-type drug efflux transporter P55 n=1 Tax=Pseudovirgaria hyperparasitica TaxID=470096 RepID=A0A6A6VUX2_9PEZI|nr:MFS general substrate transporter [Pseudovirgaria hyperparasitica]KAF2753420.1 MFS general substrate transporter [Pseudovirgaria hyperparasitica]
MATDGSTERRPLLEAQRPSASSTTTASGVAEQDELSGAQLYLTLFFPYLGQLLLAMDATITTTVSATIASDFSSLAIVSWLGSSYLVATAATQPVSGGLSDRFGRRSSLIVSIIAFGVGNLMCGYAESTSVMVAGRVVAGAGGGAMSSITQFITSDILPLRKRPLWQGIGNVVWAAGIGLGGVVGGAINDWIGWRWAFLGLTPLTLLILLGSILTLPSKMDKTQGVNLHLDYPGAILLSTSLVLLILGLNLLEGGQADIAPLALLGIAAVLLLFFIVFEFQYATEQIIPIQLLGNRSIAGVCMSGFFVSASMYTLLFYVPLLIQVRGFTTSEVGIQFLGEVAGASIGSFATGATMRAIGGYGLLKPLVYLVFVAAPLLFFLSTLDWPIWTTVVSLIAMGSGFGSVLTVIVTGLLAVTEQRIQAPVTGMLYAFRQAGSSSGLAVAGILFRVLVTKELGTGATVDNIGRLCHRKGELVQHRPEICVAYGRALHWTFLYSFILSVIAFVTGMMLRNVSLDREETKNQIERALPTDGDSAP